MVDHDYMQKRLMPKGHASVNGPHAECMRKLTKALKNAGDTSGAAFDITTFETGALGADAGNFSRGVEQ